MKATLFWGAHAPSRADAGALAGMNFSAQAKGKVRFSEGAKTSTRGACAPQNAVNASPLFTR
jgi:hypothetical protein